MRDEPDFLRLENFRREREAEARDQRDPGALFVASILASNAIHWQFDLAETFSTQRGKASATTPDFDQWAAGSRTSQDALHESAVAAENRLSEEQRSAAIAALDREWNAVVRTMSDAFQDRFERFRQAQN